MIRAPLAAIALSALCQLPVSAQSSSATMQSLVAKDKSFALNGKGMSYRFHVDEATGDLYNDHFGGLATEDSLVEPLIRPDGWSGFPGRVQREYPDLGRGDMRIPAFQVRQAGGGKAYTVSELHYQSHEVVEGKPALNGLPSTFGEAGDVSTLIVHLFDNYSSIAVDMSYSVFPEHDAVVRSVNITNKGDNDMILDKAASLSVDLPFADYEMIYLRGDWAREAQRVRRSIEYGNQGFGSLAGYSSHYHNPFLALVSPDTTESRGDAWGFSLIYTGSFSVDVEKSSQGFTRATLGLNPLQFSWPLKPGETFTTPECVAVYSDAGVGGMSRKLHNLMRKNLIRHKAATEVKPALLNSWEGLYFAYNQSTVTKLARSTADLGIKLFVLDDGWFGNEFPRTNDSLGLGDWQVNKARFPNGLGPMVDEITQMQAGNSSDKLRFGLWFEPEMVNPNSTLYRKHPDWVLHAADYPRTVRRNQLVLNLALPEVQEHVINSVANVLDSAKISYVKWDNNRGMHETENSYTSHQYMLGLYRVLDTLTTRFPDVLWEGCASGGGRFDPGILHYFPQSWTSDNTDGLDRIGIQFGTSLAYPASAMGAHISVVPNHQAGRVTPLSFRAHVAMMGGSFGLELNPADLSDEETAELPALLALADQVAPAVVQGDMYRLALPEVSNWPAAMFVAKDGAKAVVFYFQQRSNVNIAGIPYLKLQGLDAGARYSIDGGANGTYTGATLMNVGMQYQFPVKDFGSRVFLLEKQ
ncbi:alpha-galactosidase [Microdochium bolleyi]|uniref:Alpha-galactosidase n=1 Tax=Microdochium bolleyi TaxID=196109 RepID=A0A136J379_9PEZI|nr:alpha-galactosidase [Microdochium bolleyi]